MKEVKRETLEIVGPKIADAVSLGGEKGDDKAVEEAKEEGNQGEEDQAELGFAGQPPMEGA